MFFLEIAMLNGYSGIRTRNFDPCLPSQKNRCGIFHWIHFNLLCTYSIQNLCLHLQLSIWLVSMYYSNHCVSTYMLLRPIMAKSRFQTKVCPIKNETHIFMNCISHMNIIEKLNYFLKSRHPKDSKMVRQVYISPKNMYRIFMGN